jgi:hypothetical protein
MVDAMVGGGGDGGLPTTTALVVEGAGNEGRGEALNGGGRLLVLVDSGESMSDAMGSSRIMSLMGPRVETLK